MVGTSSGTPGVFLGRGSDEPSWLACLPVFPAPCLFFGAVFSPGAGSEKAALPDPAFLASALVTQNAT